MFKVVLMARNKFFVISNLDGTPLTFDTEDEAHLFIRVYGLKHAGIMKAEGRICLS